MGVATMGKVVVAATIENIRDLWEVKEGTRKPEDVRRIKVPDALVDTGAKMLSLPRRMIQELGLVYSHTRQATTSAGQQPVDIYGAVQLTIMDRECLLDVAALPDDCPVLIGYIPLEQLDLVVDPTKCQLIGNPAHGGKFLIDMY
jgi:predicted aspartyl protease